MIAKEEIRLFDQCFNTLSPENKKVQRKQYLPEGKIPVIDQGEDFIGGYTNDHNKQQDADLPVILFGDHTRRFKYVDFPFAVGADGIKILKPIDKTISDKFAYYQLIQKELPNKGYSRHYQFLRKVDFWVPQKRGVQEKIVETIETQFTRLDAAIKSLKAIKVKLALYRKSILNAAFDGYLSKSKLAFEEKLIKDIAKIKGGKRLPRAQRVQNESTHFPYIRVTDFENYSVNLQKLKFITEAAHKQISRYVIYDNEVFISIAGTIGRVGIIPPQLNGANLTENAAKLSDIAGVLPKYLMYYLSSPKAEELISFSTKSTSQPKLALFRIGNLKVKYPFNKRDQQQIVDKIESRFSIIDNLEKVVAVSLAKAEQLRRSILKAAFEGKLG